MTFVTLIVNVAAFFSVSEDSPCLNGVQKNDDWIFSLIVLDALNEPSDRSQGQSLAEQFYASSLSYVADQFENHAVNIIERLQEVDTSSDDFVSVLHNNFSV